MYKVKQIMSDAYGARVSILAHDLSSPDASDRKQMLEAIQFMLYMNWIFAGENVNEFLLTKTGTIEVEKSLSF
jgi:hypothetical protein